MNQYTQITECRICGNRDLEPILDLGMMALTGIFPHEGEDEVPKGPLELVKCHSGGGSGDDHCGLLQLRHSFNIEQMYRGNYGYRSSLNRTMVDHLGGKVRKIVDFARPVRGDLVIDIGSNDGTLLKAYPDPGLRLVGIDPTGLKFGDRYPDHIELIPEFFSTERIRERCGEKRARVITAISMFYDLQSPMEFMREIMDLLTDDGVWVFEQSYMPSMIAMNAYDTICHEHLEFYSLRQVKWMADRVGLKIVDVEFNEINGGSFSVMAARQDSPYRENEGLVRSILEGEAAGGFNGLQTYSDFTERVMRHAGELRQLVEEYNSRGTKIFGYGASTKGNVLLQHCGFTARDIGCIAEVNESKFGARTPGTAIPIISENEARSMRPDYFLVLPWHFRESIVRREQEYLSQGGALIMPLPWIEVIRA